MTAVILGMELIGPSVRSRASIFAGALFSTGQAILGTMAYYVTDYQMLQLYLTLPLLIFFSYIWYVSGYPQNDKITNFRLIPESARWLASQHRYEEADKILRNVAKRNGHQLPHNWWDELELEEGQTRHSKLQKRNFLDLFKTPKTRCRALVMFFCWPVVSMAYYGMAMKPDLLGSDPYINFIAGGIAEIPATIFMFFTVDKLGRRPLLVGGFVLAGLTLFSNLFVSATTYPVIPMIQFLLSKSCLTLCYAVIYAYTPELFPTEIRNMAVGGCSMMARVGASGASFMVMHLVGFHG